MLLTVGERVSMALLSMALNAIDCPAISFTGSQSGIVTTISHNRAQIEEIRRGDALEPPLRDAELGSCDVAHARFLLEHLPDTPAAVRVMMRAIVIVRVRLESVVVMRRRLFHGGLPRLSRTAALDRAPDQEGD